MIGIILAFIFGAVLVLAWLARQSGVIPYLNSLWDREPKP